MTESPPQKREVHIEKNPNGHGHIVNPHERDACREDTVEFSNETDNTIVLHFSDENVFGTPASPFIKPGKLWDATVKEDATLGPHSYDVIPKAGMEFIPETTMPIIIVKPKD